MDAGLDAHARKSPDHILHRHIASGTGGIGASANSAGRGIKHPATRLIGGHGIGHAHAVSVMAVKGKARPIFADRPAHHPAHLIRCGIAGGIAKADFHARMQGRDPVHKPCHRIFGHDALKRAVINARDVETDFPIGRRVADQGREFMQAIFQRTVEVGLIMRLGR